MAQHISVRVPWHDDGWKGTVCQDPSSNMACLRLKNIHENRNDAVECQLCGQGMIEHECDLPCIEEGAAFMCDHELHKMTVHPYKKSNPDTHGHFLETELIYPAYSFPARPFSRLMRDNLEKRAESYGINYRPKIEPQLRFKTIWVQAADNHRAVFDYFYKDVVPDASLCIAYAKQVPFIEDHRRVIIGMGHVKKIVPAIEHRHTEEGVLRSMVWDTMVCHSIRKHHNDGFVIPYQEMIKYAEDHPGFDLNSIIVFAPKDAFDEFSYATEHVSHDAVIDVILSCIRSFRIIQDCLDEDYSNVLSWLNSQLDAVWEDRGPFPGLGPVLTAFGIKLGIPLAREIKEQMQKADDYWSYLDRVIARPEDYVSKETASTVTPIIQKTWKELKGIRKDYLKLLCRFSLNIDQANALYDQNTRMNAQIYCTDLEILENPYLLYEKLRLKQDSLYLSVQKVDRAVFPVPSISEKYPLKAPSKLQSDNDERRVRAVVISVLEAAAESGHTFLPCNIAVEHVQELTLDPACPVTSDMISAIEAFMSSEIIKREMKNGDEYYKLVRLNRFDHEIERRIKKRLKAKQIDVQADWRQMLDEKFDALASGKPGSDLEDMARAEKAEALKVLAESRLSVLIGDAGTGKTTVLSVLCSHPDIASGGVLLLAPTGKATVRLMESVGTDGQKFTALNVAQFLIRSHRFDWNNFRYILSNEIYKDLPETVIVDEASMLTEEMFGALIQAVGTVKRIVFVGDPNQLPPIGAGKPFVDLVNLLKEDLPERQPLDQPRVAPCFAELRINRRQQQKQQIEEERLDVNLSHCFTRSENLEDDEGIISEIVKGTHEEIQIQHWESREELESKLLHIVAKELQMKNPDDQDGFNRAVGAISSDEIFIRFTFGHCQKIYGSLR